MIQTNSRDRGRRKMPAVLAIALAISLALTMPAAAWAVDSVVPSPQGTTAVGDNDVVLTVGADLGSYEGNGGVQVAAHETHASNVPAALPETQKLLSSFRVSTWGDLPMEQVHNVALTFSVGRQYAGATAYIFIQHETEPQTTEMRTETVARDGTCTITIDRLSVFSVVVDESTIGAAFAGTPEENISYVNDSPVSPQTGASSGPAFLVAVLAGCCAVAAGVVARRRARD